MHCDAGCNARHGAQHPTEKRKRGVAGGLFYSTGALVALSAIVRGLVLTLVLNNTGCRHSRCGRYSGGCAIEYVPHRQERRHAGREDVQFERRRGLSIPAFDRREVENQLQINHVVRSFTANLNNKIIKGHSTAGAGGEHRRRGAVAVAWDRPSTSGVRSV